MKKNITVILLIISNFYLSAQVGGTAAYRFLDLISSARVEALGGKNVSLQDPSIVLNNPALMDSSTANYFNVSYVRYFDGINQGYSSYNLCPTKIGYFAFGVQYVNYGEFIAANELGDITGNFTAADYALSAAWSKPIDSFVSVGVILKPLFSRYETYSSFALAADLGLAYTSRTKNFRAGLVFRNMGKPIVPYTSGNYEPLPFDIQLGITQKLTHAPFRISVVAHHLHVLDMSYDLPEEEDPNPLNKLDKNKKSGVEKSLDLFMRHIIVATEIIPSKNFYVSLAFNYQRRQELKILERPGLAGVSAGFGIKIHRFSLNYSIAKYHLAQNVQNFTLSVNLNSFKN